MNAVKRDKKVKPIRWLLNQSKKERWKMWVLIIVNILFSALSVFFAVAIRGIVDGAENITKTGNVSSLIFWAIVLVGIVILQFCFRIIINGLTEHIKAKLEIAYKSFIFSQIIKKKYNKINAFHSGELMNRLTADVSVISDGVTTIVPNIVAAVARLVFAVVALIYLDWIFAVAFLIAGVLVFTIISLLRGKLRNLHLKSQETDGKTRSFMQECIENLLAIKVFSAFSKIEKQADDLQNINFKIKMKRKNYAVLGSAAYNLIFSAGYLFALIYGSYNIFLGVLSSGSLMAILQLVNNVQVPFASLSGVLPKYYAMVASTERLMEIENIEEEKVVTAFDKDKEYKNMDSIVIDNVSFKYDRDRVLTDASFTVNKGDFVAIAGISGIGKSTLLKLMLGVYDLDEGSLYIKSGENTIPLDNSTRTLFSYVPQGNMLFSGTLKDNLSFVVNDISDEDINEALKLSCAEEFVNELPNGLDTVVGEKGVGLSEGQIQRIAIARALICKAPIILLDEATSALDEETEKELLNNLKSIRGITLIIVSHKKAALEICNRRIEIRNKRIKEIL